jgi:hypothetical protein
MQKSKSNSVFILKLIGSLFSVVSFVLLGLITWLISGANGIEPEADYKGFVVATGILNASTATIAIFIWWIVSHHKRFLNYD